MSDKRALYRTGEFSSVLKVAAREGNTLSETLRDIWDTGYLRITTKNNPITATDAHIGVIGHITVDELRKQLTSLEMSNGFANRFLWLCVKRSKRLPSGGNLRFIDFPPLIARLHAALQFAQVDREVCRDETAEAAWDTVYGSLTDDKTGLANTILARSEPTVLRLSMLYALLDQSEKVRLEHLNAALALWQYAEDSATFLFGDAVGDETADAILYALTKMGNSGLTRKQLMVDVFHKHITAADLGRALELLIDQGRVSEEQQDPTGARGRPATTYRLTHLQTCELSEQNTRMYLIASNEAAKRADLVRELNHQQCELNTTAVHTTSVQECDQGEIPDLSVGEGCTPCGGRVPGAGPGATPAPENGQVDASVAVNGNATPSPAPVEEYERWTF